MVIRDRDERLRGGITFSHPGVFWLGIAAVTAGTALHLPMYIESRTMEYRMAGMAVDGPMKLGMLLIVIGIAATAYGLFPRRAGTPDGKVARLQVQALDDARIRPTHVGLILVMAVAVTIDIMKPTTIAFVVPGMAAEYGLKSPLDPHGTVPVALLPLVATIGMVLGAFGWGWLGDRIGRRASILLAGVLFIGTSICGAMPSFSWNLLMCFLMGAAVGGMVPIAFSLLAETIPARHRSWLMVLIGGDVAGAYIVTSYLSSWLQPHFGWRIMWLLGLPTGILLILMNRWIPESPRFLISNGRVKEAEAILTHFGATIVEEESELAAEERLQGGFGQLLRGPFKWLSVGLLLFGLAYGIANFGFLLWLPTNLRALGLGDGAVGGLLGQAALIGFPATFIVAILYGFWSSKKTMVLVAALTVVALAGFVALGDNAARQPLLLEAIIVVLIQGVSSMLAVITPYASEVYPTRIRARGAGLASGAARIGGIATIGLTVVAIAPPDLVGAALLSGIPAILATLAIAKWGTETRRRRLEEITAEEIALTPSF